jgi:hypothetical protein
MHIMPITDQREVEQIESLKRVLVDEPAHLNLEWIRQKGWIAVPVESALHFSDADAGFLAQAFQAMECPEVFAIATEPLANFPNCFVVTTSTDGLLEFSRNCGHFNFVLLPGDRSAAVLCTVYDYFLVSGPSSFVGRAVGGDIAAARARFDEVASDPWWEGRLLKISANYRQIPKLIS